MTGPLPSTAGLERVDARWWRALGDRLRLNGPTPRWLASMWQDRTVTYEGLQWPVRLWRARTVDDPAARIYRMFCLRDPVRLDQAADTLGAAMVAGALDCGLLCRARDDHVVSRFDLRFFHGLWVLCDDLGLGGDAVFGTGAGDDAFPGVVPARLVTGGSTADSAVDVGCGAGAIALWMSRFARRVLATDINPRALGFVRWNAALNGIGNVEVVAGDLLAPLGAERFDLLVAQPPFVPRPPDATPATYRLGGPLGTELPHRVLAAAGRHLTPHGRAAVVFEHPVRQSAPVALPDLAGAGRRALVLLGDEVDADAYSVRYALPALRQRDPAGFEHDVGEMRQHLHSAGIRGVRPAVGVVESADGRAWTDVAQLDGPLWNRLAPGAADRLLAGHDLLHSGSARRAWLPAGSTVLRSPAEDHVTLLLAAGVPSRVLRLTRAEWAVLERMREGETVRLTSGAPPEELALLARLLRAGLVEP
ncbi:methyltransferase [Actinoplanes sp. NEAU-A12]|uniref:Methyltransferase n=1 Tax=Actinoplanes sandaracinus TaxID=3045177 RepID=A0ABT6WUC3_9ACTN|nr:methyltransferase [Actinoplanes sandaracinus]MDI6103351.1 methyltransferase [Actinoplanes sandaracinus]